MDETSALLDLMACTYDAARGVAGWGEVVHELSDLLGADEIALRRRDPDDLLAPAFVGRNLSESSLDDVLRTCRLLRAETPDWFVTGTQACVGRACTCAAGPAEACYLASVRSHGGCVGLDLVAICRTPRPPFWEGLARLKAVLPHLLRASELERERAAACESMRGLVAAASQSPNVVLVVDGALRIRFRNETARQFLHAGLGWRDEGGRLAVDAPGAECALRCALGRPSREAEVVRVEPSPPAPGAAPLLVVAEPLPNAGASDDPPSRRLLVVVAGPAIAGRGFDLKAATSLYRLSPAEARLAERLGEGARLEAAAASLGITLETARTYLKSLFRKTRTARQSELVRLLVLGPRRLACAERDPSRTQRTLE